MTYEELLNICREKEIPLTEEKVEAFKKYAKLLVEWNQKMNLTAIKTEPEIVEKHFYDCLLLLKGAKFDDSSLADMGSGAGFPGVVIAIMCPTCKVTLIDSTAKKFTFLTKVKETLGLTNVRFCVGRVENIKEDRGTYDFVTARGFASLSIILEVGAPLAKVGGTVIAMKSIRGEEELSEATKAIDVLKLKLSNSIKETLPTNKGVRINYFFKKIEATPNRYPRPWERMKKRPL